MTQEEVQERNQQIALMLGWEESSAHKEDQYGYYQCIEGYSTPYKNTLDEQAVQWMKENLENFNLDLINKKWQKN